jgi:hypothetical protein
MEISAFEVETSLTEPGGEISLSELPLMKE